MGLALMAWARATCAQDFAAPEWPGPSPSPAALVERALPPEAGLHRLEAAGTSWLGIPELVTRALCLGLEVGPLRAAGGLSRTGPAEIGWDACGVAVGAASPFGGAAARLVARRERAAPDESGAEGVGLEAGGGGWVRAGRSACVWASAPQLWTEGPAPALPRPLAVGVAVTAAGGAAWLEREAPARPGDDVGTHRLGLALVLPGARVWVEGRDRPTRGAMGLWVRARRVGVGARVEGHPVLGDTVTLSLALLGARSPW